MTGGWIRTIELKDAEREFNDFLSSFIRNPFMEKYKRKGYEDRYFMKRQNIRHLLALKKCYNWLRKCRFSVNGVNTKSVVTPL